MLDSRIERAVNLKRQGKYKESCEIYSKLNEENPYDPVILKSWAKTLAVSGDYKTAADYFLQAADIYTSYMDSHQAQICREHYLTIVNSNKNSKEFFNYLREISGNSDYSLPSASKSVLSNLFKKLF